MTEVVFLFRVDNHIQRLPLLTNQVLAGGLVAANIAITGAEGGQKISRLGVFNSLGGLNSLFGLLQAQVGIEGGIDCLLEIEGFRRLQGDELRRECKHNGDGSHKKGRY